MQADTDRSLAMIDTQWGTPPYFTASAAGRHWCDFAHIAATGTPFPEIFFGGDSYRLRMLMLYCFAVLSQYDHPQPSRLSFLKTTGVKSLSGILETRPVPL